MRTAACFGKESEARAQLLFLLLHLSSIPPAPFFRPEKEGCNRKWDFASKYGRLVKNRDVISLKKWEFELLGQRCCLCLHELYEALLQKLP